MSMEWNSKTPSMWDWDNLVMLNPKSVETQKKLQPAEWGVDWDIGEIDSRSLNPSGGGGGCGGSGSDLGHGSLSNHSKSASFESSSTVEMKKTTMLTFDHFEDGLPIENGKTKEMARASVGSSELSIGLKLGKRTYFEDDSAGSYANTTAKRTRSSSESSNVPCCQVEGCNLDLSSTKDYHRKHRVCESHSKCPKVIVGGLERRFCQQCSRFHSLSEFDEKKRSCRRRLSDHNARRRKPLTEPIQYKTTRMSSSFYLTDGRQQMNFLNGPPLANTRPASNLSWESTYSSDLSQTKGFLLRPHIEPQIAADSQDTRRLLQSKGATTEVLNQDFEESMIASKIDTTQDLRRALSLLSTNTWRSYEPETIALNHPTNPNHAEPLGLPVSSSSEYWRNEQPSSDSWAHMLATNHSGGGHLREF